MSTPSARRRSSASRHSTSNTQATGTRTRSGSAPPRTGTGNDPLRNPAPNPPANPNPNPPANPVRIPNPNPPANPNRNPPPLPPAKQAASSSRLANFRGKAGGVNATDLANRAAGLDNLVIDATLDPEGAARATADAKQQEADRVAAEAAAAVKTAAADAVRPRVLELQDPDHLTACVESMRTGDLAMVRAAYRDLVDNQAVLDVLGKDERATLLRKLTDDVLATRTDHAAALDAALDEDPALFAGLLLSEAEVRVRAGAASRFGGGGPTQLGVHEAAIARTMVRKNWAKAALDPGKVGSDVYQWLFTTIDTATWNDPAFGLAARIYNNLWNLGQTERICDLITAGVNSSLPARYGDGEVREDRPGCWSGFIQPLQHLMGHYVRRVTEEGVPSTDPTAPLGTLVVPDSADSKVKAAARILTELTGRQHTEILTKWADIAGSEMVDAFRGKPGTIWGFEDVRLPYVQAARATDDGQQPLRMIELWDAVSGVLAAQGYQDLLVNPDATITRCVEAGVTAIKQGIAAKFPKWANIEEDTFIAEFRLQCTEYLKFLARQTPAAKIATADLNGKQLGKLMGAMACKVGLWWAQKEKRPVYYCLDGIRMDEATSYKAVKNKEINEYWAATDAGAAVDKYGEVITFQEIREILKFWHDTGGRAGLKDTVVFVEKGHVLSSAEAETKVKKWRADMQLADDNAPLRRRAAKDVHRPAIDALDPELWPSLTDRQASQVVNKTELLKLAARSQTDLDLLGAYLKNDSAILYELGILPDLLPTLYSATEDADLLRRPARFVLKSLIQVTVCPALRVPLLESIERRFG